MQLEDSAFSDLDHALRLNRFLHADDSDGFILALAELIVQRDWVVGDDAMKSLVEAMLRGRAMSGRRGSRASP